MTVSSWIQAVTALPKKKREQRSFRQTGGFIPKKSTRTVIL